jgi:hypothetical protein
MAIEALCPPDFIPIAVGFLAQPTQSFEFTRGAAKCQEDALSAHLRNQGPEASFQIRCLYFGEISLLTEYSTKNKLNL